MVIVAHVLEHVSDWKAVLAEGIRVLRTGRPMVLLFSPGFVRNGPRSRTDCIGRNDFAGGHFAASQFAPFTSPRPSGP